MKFNGQKWIILDSVKRYLVATDSVANKPFDSKYISGTSSFDPSNPTKLAYWLNNDYYNSLIDKDWILDANWEGYQAKVGLISTSDWSSLQKLSRISFYTSLFWTRTPYSSTNVYTKVGVDPNGGYYPNVQSSYNVVPAIYLKSGVFANGGSGTPEDPYTLIDNQPPTITISNSNPTL